MGNGPSDEDVRRAARAAREARETAAAMEPGIERAKLDPARLKAILDELAPGNDAADDGVYDQRWLAWDTFYRHTEEYVASERRASYEARLRAAFPGKQAAPPGARKVIP
jgi:hypothetical protein